MLEHIASFITGFIQHAGYLGIALLMTIESACIPLPSEIIMPFSGYLASTGALSLWLVALAGAVGNVLGSLVAYAAGALGGRPFVERYGKYILMTHHDIDHADRWFNRHGNITIFICRLLPGIRTFIAFPAGVSRMPLWRFNLYTFVGSYIWCYALGWIGFKLGEHWHTIGSWFHRFDALIGALVLVGIAWYIRRHIRLLRS